jgi:hypothetical protein
MNKAARLYCIDESVYSQHLTKRREYEVVDWKEGQVRIKGDTQRLVWLPAACFSEGPIPAIRTVKIDDPITDPENDCVEVTVEFTNEERRWTRFTTPTWIAGYLQDTASFLPGSGFIIVKALQREAIETTIHELDRQNELLEQMLKY